MKKKISEKKRPELEESIEPGLILKPGNRGPASQESLGESLPIRNPSIDSNGRRPENLRSKKRHSSTTQTKEQAEWQKPFKLGGEMKPYRPPSALKHCFFCFVIRNRIAINQEIGFHFLLCKSPKCFF